jgi:hypothetical protein
MKKVILVGLIIVSMLALYTMVMAAGQGYGILTWNESGTKAYGSSTGNPTVHEVTSQEDPFGTTQPYSSVSSSF